MEKDQAKQRLQRQSDRSQSLASTSSDFKKWRRDTQLAIANIFGSESRHVRDFSGIRYTPMGYNMANPDPAFQRALHRGLDNARAVLASMIDEIDEYGLTADQGGSSDPLTRIEHICARFPIVARQLRDRHQGRSTLTITDEYDVQDLLHALLKIDFDDVRAEEWSPSYAGKGSRLDFLIADHAVVVEVKKTRDTLRTGDLGDQLIVDIARYSRHPDCDRLICFIYDPELLIGNPAGLETDLSGDKGGLPVHVIVSPKGS